MLPPPDLPPASTAPRALHVLLVDDEELLVQLNTELLVAQGFRVSGFTDPQAALVAVRQEPSAFDVVITDLTMPGMTGLELAAVLRRVRSDLPIILTSGGSDVTQQRAERLGISRMIDKPTTAGELVRCIREVVRRVDT